MPATKTYTAFTWSSGSATTSGTTNAINTAALYAASVYAFITQVGTATTPAAFTIQQSPEGVNYFPGPTYTAGTAAGNYSWIIALDPTCTSVKIVYTSQAGGTSSTLSPELGEVTGV